MTTTDIPKPGPAIVPAVPIRAVPVKEAGGLNDNDAEARRRIVAGLLPYIKGAEDVLLVAEWIAYGSADEEDES